MASKANRRPRTLGPILSTQTVRLQLLPLLYICGFSGALFLRHQLALNQLQRLDYSFTIPRPVRFPCPILDPFNQLKEFKGAKVAVGGAPARVERTNNDDWIGLLIATPNGHINIPNLTDGRPIKKRFR